ncbi:MAG: tRNA pseudouridine(13) synthase TruD [Planctomycetota bacterium]
MSDEPHANDDVASPVPRWAPGYARASGDRAPIAFRFRARPEDFIVEELAEATEQPDPAGTHVWFTVEKRDVSTPEAARRIARALGRPPADVAFAGRKDAVAVTRQRMSIEHVDVDALLALDVEGLCIRDPLRCRRRIRLGQTRGNRFHLRLTDVAEADRGRLEDALAVLGRDGFPNYYGAQRFGAGTQGLDIARALVVGEPLEYLERLVEKAPVRFQDGARELLRRIVSGNASEKRRATELRARLDEDLRPVAEHLARRRPEDPLDLVRAVPKRTRSFHLAILQSLVFNRVLAERVRAGTGSTVLAGDVVRRADGRHRVAESAGDGNYAGGTPTGPLWAAGGLAAVGEPGRIEREALAAEGLTPDDLRSPGGLDPRGARRVLMAPAENVEVGAWDDGAVWVAFDLPVGSYATAALAELSGSLV